MSKKIVIDEEIKKIPTQYLLEIPYDILEEMNLDWKKKRESLSQKELEEKARAFLSKETGIKKVMVCFSDIEGRFHSLDYDKDFFLGSVKNLTFDGSSIHGFTAQHQSDLRFDIDWSSLMFLPSDVFGAGKVLFFANILTTDFTPFASDFRGLLQAYTSQLKANKDMIAHAAVELEGFIMENTFAEQHFDERQGFTPAGFGGYFHTLPLSTLQTFINRASLAHKAMGFENEKEHPEVAPGQFELNFSYTDVLHACDLIQLYKLTCRQIANSLGVTACFLPKPIVGINGSAMHTNFSLNKNGKNTFFDKDGKEHLSSSAWTFIQNVLGYAQELCLVYNSSVNAYRRLDPHFEAPNEIKVSPIDRGSMIRIPAGNEKTARIEVRSPSSDTNPYLWLYTLLRTGLEGNRTKAQKNARTKLLPDNIYDALRLFNESQFAEKILGRDNKRKYLAFKTLQAERTPRNLGTMVKNGEVLFHHEITNQQIWNAF